MEAIEFKAKAEDGIIKIPKKYLSNLSDKVHVIILINKETIKKQKNVKKKGLHLTSLKIKTKGLKFDRNEANANCYDTRASALFYNLHCYFHNN